ncbi:Aminomethyltransferase (glycine cleavage system T protein) [Prochlorococcus marinus str. SS2]|nr:Aminomethyltransferase (glycine cleavage system T protein) [Prochlorococcus marinus str. SS2]
MVEFAGWNMPIQFSGLINEHNAVRKNSGIFDISHMGVFSIQGKNPKDALQTLVPSDLHRIGPGEACYTVLLNNDGGIIDDLIVYDLGTNDPNNEECILIVINAGCTQADIDWIKEHLSDKNLKVCNAKGDGVLLALQGPDSTNQLRNVLGESLTNIPKFGHREIQVQLKTHPVSFSIFIARTGYTGEDGYEILLNTNAGKSLWRELIENGVTPCGLGARDTLRLEAGMPLYGNDINNTTTPFEAGLGWLVHLETPDEFIGKAALVKQTNEGINKKLVALKIEGRAIARKGYQIMFKNKFVGEITSGSWSPTLNEGIALAYLPIDLTKIGTAVSVQIRDKLHTAIVAKKPFYRRVS